MTGRKGRAHPPQQQRAGAAGWVVAAAAVIGIAGLVVALAGLALSGGRDADQRTCRTIAWAALPAGANLPSGWSIGSSRVFVNNLTSTLVGPVPSDQTQTPAVYVSVSCHGSDAELALRRSHEAELAAGSVDLPLANLGDESFAVRSATAGSITVFLRRGALVADLTAPPTLDQSIFVALATAVDDALLRVVAAGPDGPAVAQPARSALPSAGAAPSEAAPDGSAVPSLPAVSHVAPDLEALLPAVVDATSLVSQSVTGDTGLEEGPTADALRAAMTGFGKTAADLVIAQAVDPTGILGLRVDAYRVTGVSASDLRQAVVASQLADASIGATSAADTFAGYQVTRIDYPNAPPTYFYELRDVVFAVQAADESLAGKVLGLLK